MKKLIYIVFGIAAAFIFMFSTAKDTKAFDGCGYGCNNPYRVYSPVANYGNYYYSSPYYYYYSYPYYYGYNTYYPYNYWYNNYRPWVNNYYGHNYGHWNNWHGGHAGNYYWNIRHR